MNIERRHLVLAVIGLVVIASAGFAVAQTMSHSASEGVVYQTNSGVEVTLGDNREVAAVPFSDDETFSDGNLTVSGSNAAVEVDDSTYGSDPVTIRNADVSGELTVERTDLDRQITIEDGDANLLQLRDYQVDNGSEDLAYNSDDGLTVTLTGFDSIGIAAVDAATGEPLDTDSVGDNGVATFELPPGQRAVRLEASPSELEVRNEADPNELITGNVSLRARLFADDDLVIERPVENGTVPLDGVPLDEEIVITVREENADYTYRRILIDSAIQTSEIYLLPTTEPSAEVRFQLQDETGRFDSDSTRLYVEKPITRDFNGDGENTTQYQTISGDRVGADGEFPTILVDSERYRLRVVNDAGETRVLGSYTVQGAAVSQLPIGEVEFTADVEEGAALQASLRDAPDGASHNHEVRLVYLDPEGGTDEIEVSIENSTGGAIRPTTTETIDDGSAYVETYPITDPTWNPEEDTATVTVEATRGMETETFEAVVGDIPDVFTDTPLNPDLLELIAVGSIIAVIGLLVIVKPALAALVGPGYAGLLSLVGLVPIPMAWIVLAGLVGVLAVVGSRMGLR